MTARFDLRSASPSGYAAMLGLNAHVRANGLDPSLRELITIRVSQINAWNRLMIAARTPSMIETAASSGD